MNIPARTLILISALFMLPVMAAQSPVIWTGGITLDERESAPDTGTRLEFFVTGGKYLSGISVNVRDNNGRELVNTVTEGPWLILDLAPGTYRIQATRSNGDVQGGNIEVSGDGGNFAFMFPGD